MASADQHYALEAGKLATPCDHRQPVTVGLPALPGVASGSGLLLVVESTTGPEDAVTRSSTILGQLQQARSQAPGRLRIPAQVAQGQGIQTGERLRLTCGERAVLCEAWVDAGLPEDLLCAERGSASVLFQDLGDGESAFPQVSVVKL
jgi:hypothetical protein